MREQVNAGDLDKRITFQTKPSAASASYDSAGQEIETWTDIRTVWGSIEPLSGRELTNALALRNDVTHKITTRYFANVNPALCRWQYGSRYFNVVSVLNTNEKNVSQVYICTEVVSS